jgi:hypothetical protein
MNLDNSGLFEDEPFKSEPLGCRVQEELGYRREYGQGARLIYMGIEAYEEAMRTERICIVGEAGAEYVTFPDRAKVQVYMGMELKVDPSLAPTCFRIE